MLMNSTTLRYPRRVAIEGDTTVRLWDVHTQTPEATLAGRPSRCPPPSSPAHTLKQRPTHRAGGGGAPGHAVPPGHTHWVLCVAWSPDAKRLASGGADHKVILWNPVEPKSTPIVLTGHKKEITALSWEPLHRCGDNAPHVSVGMDGRGPRALSSRVHARGSTDSG